jgi:nucleotide-binding universal stress UspA family protein
MLAKMSHASLTLIHVIETGVRVSPEQLVDPSIAELLDRGARTWGRRRLQILVRRAQRQGIRATGRLINGLAADGIARAARTMKADLLVVGTHGRTGLSRFFLGSVAQRVVANAPCPVLTVRGSSR